MASLVETESAPPRVEPRRSNSGRVWRRLRRQPVTVAAGVVLLIIFVGGALVPQYAPSQAGINLTDQWRNHAPLFSGWHLLGTNVIGKDMLLQLLLALHTNEQSALAATLFATALGVALGSIAGYRGGWVDALLMRIADLLGVFPLLMVFLAAYTYFNPVTAWKAALVFAFFLWIPVARVVRAEISSLREREFVQAELSLGASDRRIFFRHLLPNASGTIIIAATSLLAQVFLLEAMLDFLGARRLVGDPADDREPDRRGTARRLPVWRGLVDVGQPGGAARADPRLHQSPGRRPLRRPPPAAAALAGGWVGRRSLPPSRTPSTAPRKSAVRFVPPSRPT